MLKTLTIKNYALIEFVFIEFENGLNIITGETGAGKSIIIDALNLILGDRASSDSVRKGADKAIVEGVMGISNNSKIHSLLKENEIEFSDEIILRREVSAKGQSRCFVNDSPVTLNLMKDIGNFLVDLHGQHEHQSLLRTETHIELLDEFGGLEGLVSEYKKNYAALIELLNQFKELLRRENELKEKRSLYEFQINEIDNVSPHKGEEEELENELRILENSEKLYESTMVLYKLLYEGNSDNGDGNTTNNSVYDLLVKTRNQLEDLASIDKSFEEPKNECASAAAIVSEITKFIQAYNSKIEFNPERLEEIRERLGLITILKKKYGGSLDAVISYREKIGQEFKTAENFDEEIVSFKNKIELVRSACGDLSHRISTKRNEITDKISKSVCAELFKMGIPNAKFEVKIEQNKLNKPALENPYIKIGKDYYEANYNGIDNVEFYISTNIGEDTKPLVKVASGGEISRIMLALKTILSKADRLPLLVFDEIDVGISGRIAQAVGKSLKNLSQFHQVISITHLAQIAGFADCHFTVEKIENKNRTISNIKKLNEEERIKEVARLLSGDVVTEASINGAKQLMIK